MRAFAIVLVAGCGFHAPSTNGNGSGDDDAGVQPGSDADSGNTEDRTLVFDTQADFTHAGTAFDQVGTEPWGSLTSAAYVEGALVAHGVNQQLWDPGAADAQLTFAAVAGIAPDGAGMWRAADVEDGAQLRQLGITSTIGFWSAWFEGEIFLGTAGMHQFSIDADDVAFVELAAPGTTAFHQVVTGRWNSGSQTGGFAATAPGWYPIRVGWAQGLANSHLRLHHASPGGPLAVIPRALLRGRGDPQRGLMRDVFDHQVLASASETIGIEAAPFMPAATLGPPGATFGEWSARWTGEVYITTQGDYTLAVASDDGNHVVLDASTGAASWGRDVGNGSAHSATTATLAAGWQPVVVDYNQVGGAATLDVRWSAAPDPGLVGQPLSLAQLRPVETRRGRIVPGAQVGFNALIKDATAAGAASTLAFPGFTGETAGSVAVTAHVLTLHPGDLNVELIRPDGTALRLCSRPSCPFTSGMFQTTVTDAAFLAPPSSGAWKLRVWDDQGGNNHQGDSIFSDAYLTLDTTHGAAVVADRGIWTSQIVALDKPLDSIAAVTWMARTPRSPDDVQIRLRACAIADCSSIAWSAPVTNGGTVTLPAGVGYLQVQATLDSDSDRETELERLAIAYRVTP